MMTKSLYPKLALAAIALGLLTAAGLQEGKEWAVHDPNRPQPTVVTPGTP